VLSLQVGLVAEENTGLKLPALDPVAAAIQKQVTEDFGPFWGVEATVEALEVTRLQDVKDNYWPVIVSEAIGVPGESYHLDPGGRPQAVVKSGSNWSVRASHECLEMLANPFGDRLIPGPSLKPDQELVEYLVEVCDPCQHMTYTVKVDGEPIPIPVSDFVTPDFYNRRAETSKRKTFQNNISEPLEIMSDCQLRWRAPKGDGWWLAEKNQGGKLKFTLLGAANPGMSPREALALMALSTAAQPEAKAASTKGLTMRPEFYHLVYRLANDLPFYNGFKTEARKVYLEYGIDIPQELFPDQVTLPSQEELKKTLDFIGSSLAIDPSSEFGAPFFSSCSFVSVP
jgi:hypothetical protein